MNDINKMFNSDEINARLKNSFTSNRNPCEPTLIVNIQGDVYFPCKSK